MKKKFIIEIIFGNQHDIDSNVIAEHLEKLPTITTSVTEVKDEK